MKKLYQKLFSKIWVSVLNEWKSFTSNDSNKSFLIAGAVRKRDLGIENKEKAMFFHFAHEPILTVFLSNRQFWVKWNSQVDTFFWNIHRFFLKSFYIWRPVYSNVKVLDLPAYIFLKTFSYMNIYLFKRQKFFRLPVYIFSFKKHNLAPFFWKKTLLIVKSKSQKRKGLRMPVYIYSFFLKRKPEKPNFTRLFWNAQIFFLTGFI